MLQLCLLVVFANLFFVCHFQSIVAFIELDQFSLPPIIKHLNTSFAYFQYMYNLANGVGIEYEIVNTNASLQDLSLLLSASSVGILSTLSDEISKESVWQLSQISKIPTIQVNFGLWSNERNLNRTSNGNYILLNPAAEVYDLMIGDIVQDFGLSTPATTVLFDSYYANDFYLQSFSSFALVQMVDSSNASTVTAQLAQMSENSTTVIFLSRTSVLENYVLAAGNSFLDVYTVQWIVFSRDLLPFNCDNCNRVNFFWIQPVRSGAVGEFIPVEDFLKMQNLIDILNYTLTSYDDIYLAVSLDSVKIMLAQLMSNNETLLNMSYQTSQPIEFNLTLSNWTLEQVVQSRNVSYELGRYVPLSNWFYYQDVMAAIMKIDRPGGSTYDSYVTKYVANWTYSTQIEPLYGSIYVDVRSMNHIRIVSILQPPFLQYVSDTNHTYEGYLIDMIALLQKQINFTFELYQVADHQFGQINGQDFWNGLMGDLTIGMADLIVAPFSVTSEREVFMDFSVPYYELVGINILSRNYNTGNHLFRFVQVLKWQVWLCILGAYLLTSILLYLFEKISPFSFHNNKKKYAHELLSREFTLQECLWFSMTSLTPQGGGEAPKNLSGRMVALAWWIFCFIMVASYSANLAAFLTVDDNDNSVTSITDLAVQYRIQYAPLRGSTTESYFRRMAEVEDLVYDMWMSLTLNTSLTPLQRAQLAVWDYPVSDTYTNMWRFMQQCRLPQTLDEAIERTLSKDAPFMYIGDQSEIRYATLTNCHLMAIGAEFNRKPYALGFQTGSILKTPFNNAISILTYNTTLNDLENKWWMQNPKAAKCPAPSTVDSGIRLQSIGGVFILLGGGLVVSAVILIFEFFYYYRKNQKLRRIRGTSNEVRLTPGQRILIQNNLPTDQNTGNGTLSRRTNAAAFINSAFLH